MSNRLNSTVEAAIQSWIDGATPSNCTVVWDKQGRDRPSLPYVTLNVAAGPVLEGTPSLTYDDNDNYLHEFKKRFLLSVNIYARDNHLGLIEDIANSMYFESNKAIFRAAYLQVRTHTDIQDLSQLLDTKYEFRANVDFNCSYGESVTEEIGYIDTISYSSTFTTANSGIITFSATI